MNISDKKTDEVLSQYEPVSKATAAYTKILVTIWEKLGKPTDCSGEVGWTMVDHILRVWTQAYPHELEEMIKENKDLLGAERSVHESVIKGGILSLAYPERLFQMLKLFLPQVKLNDKKFYEKFIKRYPVFRTSNYA